MKLYIIRDEDARQYSVVKTKEQIKEFVLKALERYEEPNMEDLFWDYYMSVTEYDLNTHTTSEEIQLTEDYFD